MDLTDKVTVVTGAAQGLGEAIATEFAKHGARVVVADVNAARAAEVADSLGGLAVEADLSSEAGVDALLAAATEAYGEIDLWFSNAAFSCARDLQEISSADWDLAWHLNVMAHVWAARALLPSWVERGSGVLAQTVSAVALTLNHFDAPYATTKRAALAFNEYLASVYGSRGIQVSCYCPRGMKTPRLAASAEKGSAAALNAMATAVSAEEAGRIAVDGIVDGRFMILTEQDEIASHRRKAADYDGWISMRAAQAHDEYRAASVASE